jgi:hypothetical protein
MGFKEDLLPQIQELFSQLEASPMGMRKTVKSHTLIGLCRTVEG